MRGEPYRHQTVGVVAVQLQPLALDVRAVRAADRGTFYHGLAGRSRVSVRVRSSGQQAEVTRRSQTFVDPDANPLQGLGDLLHRAGYRAGLPPTHHASCDNE